MDTRLREVFHYKGTAIDSSRQCCTGLYSDLWGCSTNLVRGGSSILNDFQICPLAESLLGTANDIRSLGSESLMDRFVIQSNRALSMKKWTKLSKEQGRVVEDAVRNLGLTVPELHHKLEYVAKMQK